VTHDVYNGGIVVVVSDYRLASATSLHCLT